MPNFDYITRNIQTPDLLVGLFDDNGMRQPYLGPVRSLQLAIDREPSLVVAAPSYTGAADYYCNGANDAAQIRAAADALSSTGGTIRLTPGTYTMVRQGSATSDSVTHPYCLWIDDTHGPIRLVGAGRGATMLKLADGQLLNTIPLLIRGRSSSQKRTTPTLIEHLTVDGNKANQPSWTDFAVLEIAYADYVTIRGCEVKNGKIHGLRAYRDSQHTRVEGCYFNGSTSAQLRFEAWDALALGNTIDCTGSAGGGIECQVNADIDVPSQDIKLIGNSIYRFLYGIVLAGTRRALVAQNTLTNGTQGDSSSQWAIDVLSYTSVGAYDCLDVLVTDNQLYNCRNGIRVRSTGSKNVKRARIERNSIIEGYSGDPFGNVALATGISEANTAGDNDNVLIAENYVSGATTGVSTTSATTVTRNNTSL